MVAWLFPGQGSQQRGMGDGLWADAPELVAVADRILGYSVEELCRDGPPDRLRDTAYAQPALFVVEALTYLRRAATEPPPKFLAGHSLGEYAALFAAGCFDFATGVRLVRRRGELMGQARDGGMLAVVGAGADAVTDLLARCGIDDVDVANHNADDQVVLAGAPASLDTVAQRLAAQKLGRGVPLRVSAAFHSRHMAAAAEAFAADLVAVRFADPAIPVVANVTGRPYRPGAVAELLGAQVARPVLWRQSMRFLIEHGVREAVELGPGTVLTGLWRGATRQHRPAARAEALEPAARAEALEPAARAEALEPAARAEAPEPAARAEATEPAPSVAADRIRPERLGSAEFRRDYGVRYAYAAGAMYHGIASVDLVVRMGRAGLIGFFGAGGLRPDRLDEVLTTLRGELGDAGPFGMNLLCTLDNPGLERQVVELYLRHDVRYVEAAAYPQLTAPLVRFRFTGAHLDAAGNPVAVRHVLAKVSRPEVAAAFLRPPPAALLRRLVAAGELTEAEAGAAARLPVSGDLCVESDSAGHTDGGVALTLLPVMQRLRDELSREHGYPQRIRVGAAGGLGTPEALAAVFVLGADFVVTGSVNQCSPQAGTSDDVKELLSTMDVQDTAYAPAGDLLEAGARVQVLRKGTLFPARAQKLYEVYRNCATLDDIDEPTRRRIERDYFGRSLADVWAQTRDYLAARHPDELARAERDERHRMVLVLRWYFRHTTELAVRGDPAGRSNYQVHCGPAMGAFNRWARGTELADWRRRDVDVIGERLMRGAAELLDRRLAAFD